ncbi:MAG: ParA family protein [Fidelibacterota bacterium]
MRKISVVSTKGGTGKTTTVHNLSAALQSLRRQDPGMPVYQWHRNSVLMIDLDPQSNLSFITGTFGEGPSIYDVMTGHVSWRAAVQEISPGLDLIAADHRLARFEVHKRDRFRLRSSTQDLADYDFVFIDCPPSLGYLTQSALIMTGEFFLPLQAEYLAMRNVASLMQLVHELRQDTRRLRLSGVILSLYNTRRKMSSEGRDIIEDYFGDLVFDTVVRNTVAITEAAAQHKDVLAYRSKSPGAADFLSLAREVLRQT